MIDTITLIDSDIISIINNILPSILISTVISTLTCEYDQSVACVCSV